MSMSWLWNYSIDLQNVTIGENWVKCSKHLFLSFIATTCEATIISIKIPVKRSIIPHPSSNLLFWGEAWWLNFLKVEVTIQTLILVKGSMRGHLLGVRFLVARPGPSAVHVHLWLCSKWFLLLEVTLLNWFKLLISDVPSLTVGTIGV